MKIIIFNDTIGTLGGAEDYYNLLASLLRSKGHDVYISGFGRAEDISGEKFVYRETQITAARYWWRLTFNLRVFILFKRWIKSVKPDVIHLCNINKYTFSILLACKGYNVVHSVLDYGLLCPSKWGMEKDTQRDCPMKKKTSCFSHHCLPWYQLYPMCIFSALRKLILNRIVKNYICETPIINKYLVVQGYKNVLQAPLGINIGQWKYIKKSSYSKKILFVGLLEKNKGVEYISPIFKYINSYIPDITLQVIGDGSQEDKLKSDLDKYDLINNTELLGRKKISELVSYYVNADILIVPSIWMDNAPLVVMQAMSCGTPVVAFDRGGIGYQLDKTGILIRPFEVNEFAQKIIDLYKNPVVWMALSEKTRSRAEDEFDVRANIRKFLEIYNNLTQSSVW